jgi:secreted PhoX family phosphatase
MKMTHVARAVAAALIPVALGACSTTGGQVAATGKSLTFAEVGVPVTDAQKRAVQASDLVVVNGLAHKIGYHTILRSGQQAGGGVFGELVDMHGKPLVAADGSHAISDSNDFSSLIQKDGALFMISHFESRPGAMYLTKLGQDAESGELSAQWTRNIDFSAIHGLWVPCAGSVTPWGSHLGSEEYEPDAAKWNSATGKIDPYYNAMGAYTDGDLHRINPYYYGYPVEVAVENAQGATQVMPHYSMGRLAIELAKVMPDQRTVYISDDGTNVGFYMFIADKPGDLSAGTLYAATWLQLDAKHGGNAKLSWVDLGHATDVQIKGVLDQGPPRFGDIFASAAPNKDDGSCPAGYGDINTSAGHECLMIKPGMEKVASRLETRRYAALMGATTEFRKEEGIAFDPATRSLFVSMSEVARGMEDYAKNGKPTDKYDAGGPNDVRLPYNRCGVVYRLPLGSDAAVGSDYVAKSMHGLVAGQMTQAWDKNSPIPAYRGALANNKCAIDGIANPDNLTFIDGYATLIIGEDTGSGHQNDAVWAYSLKDGQLSRIETTPYGSETTGVYWYPNINGHAYLMSVIQHPYGESDEDKAPEGSQARRAYTGYIGPFLAMDAK